jgi:hypothetical protein
MVEGVSSAWRGAGDARKSADLPGLLSAAGL